MAEGMLKAARGERPDNVVNPQVFDQPAFREKLVEIQESSTLSCDLGAADGEDKHRGSRPFAVMIHRPDHWSPRRTGRGLVAAAGDISALDQHFNQPGKDISPWMFVPT